MKANKWYIGIGLAVVGLLLGIFLTLDQQAKQAGAERAEALREKNAALTRQAERLLAETEAQAQYEKERARREAETANIRRLSNPDPNDKAVADAIRREAERIAREEANMPR